MGKKKMCPMKFNGAMQRTVLGVYRMLDAGCEREECAWWDVGLEECAVTILADLAAHCIVK